MAKNGDKGMKAVLKDCTYSVGHNFNFLNMSKLLHKQDWTITHVNKSWICIENGIERVIKFDIVVPTEKGAIHACKFMCTAEITTSSTECGTRFSINRAHCLLGHQNKDSMHKTAREWHVAHCIHASTVLNQMPNRKT